MLLLPLQGHLGTSLGAVDANGQVVETIGHDAFGQRTDATAAAQSHRFAGEYWDEDAQLVYLRARWYDPKLGRFISGDPFEGRQGDPRSLNRYSYAHGDPVHNTDPTGEMSLGDTGAAMNIMSTFALSAVRSEALDFAFSKFASAFVGAYAPTAGHAIGGSPGGAALVTTLAVMCRTSKKCLLKGIPVLSTGLDIPFHSAHILMATMGGGFTKSQGGAGALPFALTRGPRNAVRNRQNKWPCAGQTGKKSGTACDEYPYATTLQGGEANWQMDRVSLAALPAWESNVQGGRLSGFYRFDEVKLAPHPQSLFRIYQYLPFQHFIFIRTAQ